MICNSAIILAQHASRKYSKKNLLRVYLLNAYLGCDIKGTDMASKKLFNESIDKLSLTELSIIASMLKYPKPSINSESWNKKILTRSNYAIAIYRNSKKNLFKS